MRERLEVDPELGERALVVAALVDDRLAHRDGKAPADQILRRIAERAEEEEVEDHHPGERRERDGDTTSDGSPAHSSVHSSGSVLRRPLAMYVDAMIASEISTEPISTERGVVSQPELVVATVVSAAPGALATGAGPGCSARICWVIW